MNEAIYIETNCDSKFAFNDCTGGEQRKQCVKPEKARRVIGGIVLINRLGQNFYNAPSFKAIVVKPPIITVVGPTEEKRKRTTCHFDFKKIPHMPCACCGKEVLTFKEIDGFQNTLKDATGTELRHHLRKRWNNYKATEKKVVRKIIKTSYDYEDKNLQELLQVTFDNSRKELVETQKNIIIKLKNISNNLEGPIKPKLKHFFDKAIEIVESEDIAFKRKTFLQSLAMKAAEDKDPRNIKALTYILAKAETIPTSAEDVNAFIVKYSRRSPKEIAYRLLSRNAATAEHIKAFTRNGLNDKSNYLLECNKCNEARGSIRFKDWVKQTPQFINNVQKFIEEAIAVIKSGKMNGYEKYPLEVKETLKRESGGIIDIDLGDYEKFLSAG
ncbi:MAG: hypothetical protein PHX18_04550 [Candidatus Gastranaerophilales bacterium]|nr:hypothetical protein [Candidatus Gastranaerophilales bacterium]